MRRAVTCRRPWRGSEVGEDARVHTHTRACPADVLCAGEPFDPVPLLNNAVANIICQIVFGRRFDYTDHVFQSMLHHLTEMAYLEGSIWALVGETFTQLSRTSSIISLFSLQTAVRLLPIADETPAGAPQPHLQQLRISAGIHSE